MTTGAVSALYSGGDFNPVENSAAAESMIDYDNTRDTVKTTAISLVSAPLCALIPGGFIISTIAGVALSVILFLMLVFALRSTKAAFITLFNIPLGLIGSVAAVAISGGVLSVSSLIGLVTVAGFLLRNGILLLNCYRERIEKGVPPEEAIRGGSEERMVPIILTSATTAIGLVPIVLSAAKPGGELLSPLAVVQFGGLLSATVLSLIILPAAAKAFGTGYSKEV